MLWLPICAADMSLCTATQAITQRLACAAAMSTLPEMCKIIAPEPGQERGEECAAECCESAGRQGAFWATGCAAEQ